MEKQLSTTLICVLLYVIIVCPFTATCQPYAYNQKQNNVWVFNGNGLNFNSNPVTLFQQTQIPAANNNTADASVCDTGGELLFYMQLVNTPGSTGITIPAIYNRDNYPMANGVFPDEDIFNTGIVIVPMPDSPRKYYVFNESDRFGEAVNNYDSLGYTATLSYSIVDMDLAGGMGDVAPGRKNILLDSSIAMGMQAVVGDDCNIWLVTHAPDTNIFKAYEITNNGINPVPVISQIGSATVGIESYTSTITIAPNRKKIALAYVYGALGDGFGYTEVCDFDPGTGIVSNPIDIQTAYGYVALFSPNSSKLYIGNAYGLVPDSMLQYGGVTLQYDLDAPAPWPYTVVGIGWPYCGRLAPDGKIYLCSVDTGHDAFVINTPDASGTACNQVSLAGSDIYSFLTTGGSTIAMPGEVPVLYNHDTVVQYQSVSLCSIDGAVVDSTVLVAFDTTGWNYKWNNKKKTTWLTVHGPGIYTLTYYTKGCEYHIDSFVVQSATYSINIGDDTSLCNTVPFTIQAQSVPGATYLWQDGSADSSDIATQSGAYWVAVSKNGCIATDTINVKFINIKQDLGNDTSICIGTPISMTLQANVPPGATALWSNSDTTPSLAIQNTGIYWVTVTYPPCKESDTIQINKEHCTCNIVFPNAFSPNGDGKNDVFRPVLPEGCPIHGYLLNIYNRWGQLIYTSTTPSQGWDGTEQDTPADIGTYMYVVQFASGTEQDPHNQKGDITLVR